MKSRDILSAAFLLAMSAACSEKPEPGSGTGGGWAVTDGNVETTIPADRNSIILNPLSGWVVYVPLIDDVDMFWEKYEHFESSQGEVNVFDYGDVIYLRGSWTDFNPEKGVYIWDDNIDYARYPKALSLKKFEEGAKARGLKLAFTLKVDSRDANSFCTPEYVREEMVRAYGGDPDKSLEEYHTLSDKSKPVDTGMGFFVFGLGSTPRYYWSPYPDDPIFQKWYDVFIRALAARYDYPEKTAFISGLGMGKWGEYHNCIYSTGDETPKEAVFDWVTSLYADAFKYTPVVTNYHKMVGSTRGEGAARPESEQMLTSAIRKGFCMRHDAFGMRSETFGYGSWEKNFIAKHTYEVPVLGEGGWIVNQGSIDADGTRHNYLTQYAGPRELRIGEYEDMKSAYANMMDLRYDASYSGGETWSWFNDAYDYVLKFLKEDCYRIYPDKVSLPSKCRNGSEITIQHRWLNLGRAYCPTNIKQFRDRFKVTFALLKDGEPVKLFSDDGAQPHEWISGRKSYEFRATVEDVPAGSYIWGVGIIDTALDGKIGMRIAARGDYTESGWLKINKVIVE